MLPIDFKEANTVFTKPSDMTEDQCSDLPVWRGRTLIDEDESKAEFPSIISCWKLSKEDLEEVQKTGVIWLSITGGSMPPVSLFTEYPFYYPTDTDK